MPRARPPHPVSAGVCLAAFVGFDALCALVIACDATLLSPGAPASSLGRSMLLALAGKQAFADIGCPLFEQPCLFMPQGLDPNEFCCPMLGRFSTANLGRKASLEACLAALGKLALPRGAVAIAVEFGPQPAPWTGFARACQSAGESARAEAARLALREAISQAPPAQAESGRL